MPLARKELHKIFKKLEKENNIYAPTGAFSCCRGCSLTKMSRSGFSGFLYYHLQDQEQAAKSGQLNIGFGPIDNLDPCDPAYAIASILDEMQVDFDWDGSQLHKITG